jgi:hypothetical protein
MNKKTTTITMVIVALVTLAIVATVIIFAVKTADSRRIPWNLRLTSPLSRKSRMIPIP